MKLSAALLAIYLLPVSTVFAAANCQHSHSWQCQGHQAHSSQNSQTGTGIASGGQTPDQGQTNAHLGSTATHSVPMMTLQPATVIVKPPQPVMQVPSRIPLVVPPQLHVATPSLQANPVVLPALTGNAKIPPQQFYVVPPSVISGHSAIPTKPTLTPPPLVPPKQPPLQVYAIPPKFTSGQGKVPVPQVVMTPPGSNTPSLAPSRQVYPNPQPIIVGQGKVPVQKVPLQPPQKVTGQGQVPQLQPQQVPNPPQGTKVQGNVTGQQVVAAVGQSSATGTTHLLVNNQTGQIRVGAQLTKSDFGNEIVEPGIMNSRVTLYRSHDVNEMVFKDTIPMDVTGFHLVFAGIKEPVFATPPEDLQLELPSSESGTFMFYFDFASTVVPPKQLMLYDQIVDKYKSTGKRLVVTSETDGFGSSEYNTALASHRADAIVTELRNRGVKADDIDTHLRVRYGRSDPSSEEKHRLSALKRVAWVHFE